MPNSGLEKQIMEEDLKKVKEVAIEVGGKIGRGIAKSIAYPIGTTFAFPTIFKKADAFDYENNFSRGDFFKVCTIAGGIIGTIGTYTTLALTNSKLILPVVLTQIGTNIASGYSEWQKSVKERAEERS